MVSCCNEVENPLELPRSGSGPKVKTEMAVDVLLFWEPHALLGKWGETNDRLMQGT